MFTLEKLITQLRGQKADKLEKRAALTEQLAAIRGKDQVDDADEAKVEELRAAKVAIDEEVKSLEARIGSLEAELAADQAAERLQAERHQGAPLPKYDEVARVQAEKRTYSPGTAQEGVSFFRDLYASQTGSALTDQLERLQRHAAEVRVEREGGDGKKSRAMTTSSVGGLVPPQYLIDEAAPVARAGRPTANLANHRPLPAQGMTLVVPRGTTGASAAVQATQNTPVSQTDQVWTDLTIPVATVSGQADVSRQLLERSADNVDAIVYGDIAGAHAVAVDQQVLSGTGTSGEVLGILSTAGITQMSAFTAAVTIPTLYTKLAGAINAVQAGRYLAPDIVIAHTRRWAWLAGQLDSSNRPLIVPRANGPLNALGVWDTPLVPPDTAVQGELQGLPWVTDASVPTAVGTGPEDQLIVGRRADWLLWEEGDGMPRELRFEQTTGGSLTVKLVAYSYIAFTAGRYPLATAVLGGNAAAGFGLVAPTF